MVNILIVHYNTPLLTECLVKSINKHVNDAKIYIFDNSDKSPFVNKFDNVTIFDNTKGQILNFDTFLSKYKNRVLSSGKNNNYASAKHSISIDYLMDLVGADDVILLDSDVIIKKDISEIIDQNVLCASDICVFKRYNIKRCTPFVCYINYKKLKENGLTFFNENYMYGLNVSRESEKYDTGGYIYVLTKKYGHKKINNDDYIFHYKAASWTDKAISVYHYKPSFTESGFIEKYKKYWCDTTKKHTNKKVIYTCITNSYDTLKSLSYYNDDYDYICFTNDLKNHDFWEIRPIPKDIEYLSPVKQQRCIKLNPHKYLPEYDLSVWVDGNVDVVGDVNELIKKEANETCSVYVPKHPLRNCIYEEASVCGRVKKDSHESLNKHVEFLKDKKYPKNNGLLQSNIMIRYHNNKDCIKLMDKWWEILKDYSHRDQLSFNYAVWVTNVPIKYLDKFIYRSKWFYWGKGHNGNKVKRETNEENVAIQNKKRFVVNRISSKQRLKNIDPLSANINENSKRTVKKQGQLAEENRKIRKKAKVIRGFSSRFLSILRK